MGRLRQLYVTHWTHCVVLWLIVDLNFRNLFWRLTKRGKTCTHAQALFNRKRAIGRGLWLVCSVILSHFFVISTIPIDHQHPPCQPTDGLVLTPGSFPRPRLSHTRVLRKKTAMKTTTFHIPVRKRTKFLPKKKGT